MHEVTLGYTKGYKGNTNGCGGVKDTDVCENRKFNVLGTHSPVLLSMSGQSLKG